MPDSEYKKLSDKDANSTRDSEAEPLVPSVEEVIPEASFSQMTKYLSKGDKIMMWIGSFAALLASSQVSVVILLMGKVLDSFNIEEHGIEEMYKATKRISFITLGLSLVSWLLGFIYFGFWSMIGEKIGYRYKIKYLRAVLEQESAWFDSVKADSLVGKINGEIKAVQMAMSEKFAMMVKAYGMLVVGFLIGFIVGWKLTLVIIIPCPIFILSIIYMGKQMKGGMMREQAAFEKSGGFAQQALNAIKLVAAFGREKEEHESFSSHLDEIKRDTIRSKAKSGLALAMN